MIAFAFLLSMPGAPFIYYGDEIGMRYVEGLDSVEGGYGRTGSRSPMQWDQGVNAGFSTAPKEKLYISQDPKKNRPTVAAQIQDPDSLYQEVKKLLQVRKAHKALSNQGDISFVYAKKDAYPLAYIRSNDEEKVLVVINPSDQNVSFDFDEEGKETIYAFGGKVECDGSKVIAEGQSVVFIRL